MITLEIIYPYENILQEFTNDYKQRLNRTMKTFLRLKLALHEQVLSDDFSEFELTNDCFTPSRINSVEDRLFHIFFL